MGVVLVVDDEPLQRDILKTILDSAGYETHTASSGKEALSLMEKIPPDVVLSDLKMDGMDGIELLEAVPTEPYRPSIIIMTAHGTISSAVEAVKKGAFDYLTKPLDKDALLLTVGRAFERAGLLKENLALQKELFGKFRVEWIIGKSSRMKEAIDLVRKVAPSPSTVLIRGESGTGKELIARAIHYNSPRRTRPFVAVNCAAIPENLFESELFGYEPGAFTGASSRREGLFEAAGGGTLFLDEIGDLPPVIQSKLLRALQDKEIRRLGGREGVKIDVRIISATNKDLEKELARGAFREDLYYRLKVVSIELPPLRERKEDIPELAEFFIKKHNKELGRRVKWVEPQALKELTEYSWPGNIRQLESAIERAVLVADSDTIRLRDIKSEIPGGVPPGRMDVDLPDEGMNFEMFEKELLEKAMRKAGGVASKAAKLLGMNYKAFLYRLDKFGISHHGKKEHP